MVMRRITIGANAEKLVSYNNRRTSLLIQVISGGSVNIAENSPDATAGGIQLTVGDVFSRVRSLGGQPELDIFAIRATVDAIVGIVEDFGEPRQQAEVIIK